jgi:DNA-binding CsgD family transcriptional regulator
MNASAGEQDDHDIFTDKQRRVLDLLIEHKTSKEIARALGISPYTVDQRISLARAKLGVSSRNELAARYREMREAADHSSASGFALSDGEQTAGGPENSDAHDAATIGPSERPIPHPETQSDGPAAHPVSVRDRFPCPTPGDPDYRVGPEMFEGSSGGLWRLGAVVATALVLVVTILVVFAIFNQLNDMLS